MSAWRPDRLLAGFEALELAFPDDYEGAVCATLVRLPVRAAPRGAVLYVHGFMDYFFQRHMAERFALEGYAFHALDLRKHGRSLRPHQHFNFCKSVTEYYADLSAALAVIGAPVLLAGHSTGGLVCALSAHEGERRAALRALWLNSPFFDWNVAEWKRPHVHWAAAVGRYFPYLEDPQGTPTFYNRALLSEWPFDPALKPVERFHTRFGWIGAIADAHAKVQRGLAIACPVLSMYSDDADVVLDWRHIARWSRTLGPDVTAMQFPGALHDLILSPPAIRDEVFSQLFAWVERAAASPA
jgi:alpha-beta hydrolase superfamily lysophospholipase